MVSAALQSGRMGGPPVGAEHRVEMVAAVRRLYIGEVSALAAQFHPVDGALPARHVDAVHGILPRRGFSEIDRFCVAETMPVDRAARQCHRLRRKQDLRRLFRRNQRDGLDIGVDRRWRARDGHRGFLYRGLLQQRRNGIGLANSRLGPRDGGCRFGGRLLDLEAGHPGARGAAGEAQGGKKGDDDAWRPHLDLYAETRQTEGGRPRQSRVQFLTRNYQ
jgi:hypothetical protein